MLTETIELFKSEQVFPYELVSLNYLLGCWRGGGLWGKGEGFVCLFITRGTLVEFVFNIYFLKTQVQCFNRLDPNCVSGSFFS